jgi:HEPN domain-containing protein
LRLLGFELLLKCLVEAHTGGYPPETHEYQKLFASLPAEVQARVLILARDRIGPSGLDADWVRILSELGRNFVDLRYPYTRYKGLTREQYDRRGTRWIQKGAKIDAAVFRYYPEELVGLLHALNVVCEDTLLANG